MSILKKNVGTFNDDVLQNEGYLYTVHCPFSSLVANKRMTEASLANIGKDVHTIIDVGCGDGTYTENIRARLHHLEITGFDPASSAIELAKKRFPFIRFFVGDILDPTTFPSKRFDLAIVRGVLHHLSDPLRAMHHCRLLSDTVIFIEPNGNNPIVKLLEKYSSYHLQHEEQSFSSHTLKRWCAEAGLEVMQLEYIGFVPFFFPTIPSKIIYFFQPLLEKIPLLRTFFSGQIVITARAKEASDIVR